MSSSEGMPNGSNQPPEDPFFEQIFGDDDLVARSRILFYNLEISRKACDEAEARVKQQLDDLYILMGEQGFAYFSGIVGSRPEPSEISGYATKDTSVLLIRDDVNRGTRVIINSEWMSEHLLPDTYTSPVVCEMFDVFIGDADRVISYNPRQRITKTPDDPKPEIPDNCIKLSVSNPTYEKPYGTAQIKGKLCPVPTRRSMLYRAIMKVIGEANSDYRTQEQVDVCRAVYEYLDATLDTVCGDTVNHIEEVTAFVNKADEL